MVNTIEVFMSAFSVFVSFEVAMISETLATFRPTFEVLPIPPGRKYTPDNEKPRHRGRGLTSVLHCTHGAFRGSQMTQDKAQFAVNGYSLNKDWNAVLSHLWASLRARREAVICVVAYSAYFWCVSWKGPAIPCKTRLAANGFSSR